MSKFAKFDWFQIVILFFTYKGKGINKIILIKFFFSHRVILYKAKTNHKDAKRTSIDDCIFATYPFIKKKICNVTQGLLQV